MVALAALAWALVVRPGPLSLPYFWDEADVYAPGARWLAEHDLDPTPGHFPDDWSRGHPPLFYWLVALAFRALGSAPAVGHALGVPLTAAALAGTYVLARERVDGAAARLGGAAAALLLATSPLFMTMGAFLLPEMALTAGSVLALVLVARRHIASAALVVVALTWMKETGVFTALAIAGGVAIEAARDRRLRAALPSIAVSLTPLGALALFFVWQRATAGYFVFPQHEALLAEGELSLASIGRTLPSMFAWHGRVVVTLAGAASLFALRRRSLRLDAPLIAMALLALGNVVFFSRAFWLERYALPAHPGVVVGLVVLIAHASRALEVRARAFVAGAPIAAAALWGLLSLGADGTTGAPEHTFAFARVVASHREAYARIAGERSDARVVTTWPLTTELREAWLGYVEVPISARHLEHAGDEPPTHVLVDASSPRAEALRAYARSRDMRLAWTIAVRGAPALEGWRSE